MNLHPVTMGCDPVSLVFLLNVGPNDLVPYYYLVSCKLCKYQTCSFLQAPNKLLTTWHIALVKPPGFFEWAPWPINLRAPCGFTRTFAWIRITLESVGIRNCDNWRCLGCFRAGHRGIHRWFCHWLDWWRSYSAVFRVLGHGKSWMRPAAQLTLLWVKVRKTIFI